MSLESHLELRRGKEEWKHCQENVIDVMKKTLGKNKTILEFFNVFCRCATFGYHYLSIVSN
jgi:hypothetical protein